MTKTQIRARITELHQDREDCKQAISNILKGKAQSYGVGTRNLSRYNVSLGELRAYLTQIEKEIAELEAALAAGSRRYGYEFVPRG